MSNQIAQSPNFSQKITRISLGILIGIGKVFQIFFRAIIEARQSQANYRIAHQLWKTEYRNESFDRVFYAVNNGTLEELKK